MRDQRAVATAPAPPPTHGSGGNDGPCAISVPLPPPAPPPTHGSGGNDGPCAISEPLPPAPAPPPTHGSGGNDGPCAISVPLPPPAPPPTHGSGGNDGPCAISERLPPAPAPPPTHGSGGNDGPCATVTSPEVQVPWPGSNSPVPCVAFQPSASANTRAIAANAYLFSKIRCIDLKSPLGAPGSIPSGVAETRVFPVSSLGETPVSPGFFLSTGSVS